MQKEWSKSIQPGGDDGVVLLDGRKQLLVVRFEITFGDSLEEWHRLQGRELVGAEYVHVIIRQRRVAPAVRGFPTIPTSVAWHYFSTLELLLQQPRDDDERGARARFGGLRARPRHLPTFRARTLHRRHRCVLLLRRHRHRIIMCVDESKRIFLDGRAAARGRSE